MHTYVHGYKENIHMCVHMSMQVQVHAYVWLHIKHTTSVYVYAHVYTLTISSYPTEWVWGSPRAKVPHRQDSRFNTLKLRLHVP